LYKREATRALGPRRSSRQRSAAHARPGTSLAPPPPRRRSQLSYRFEIGAVLILAVVFTVLTGLL
jgi:hypothetical protein